MRAAATKLLLLAGATVVGVVALELAAARLYVQRTHRPFVRAEVAARLGAADPSGPLPEMPAAAANDPRVADQPVILHPYFGYVANPAKPRVNAYGFFGREPLATRRPDRLLVAVLGGSVADLLVEHAGATLAARLESTPPYRGRRVELINLALGGYKQPQQLLVLATLLALGAQFDLVIELDGFNEIDGAKDNQQDGVNPYFPYTWNLHARQSLPSEALVHVGRAEHARRRRAALRRWFGRWPLSRSAFCLTLWDVLDQRQEADLRRETMALRQIMAATNLTPQQTGPPMPAVADEEGLYREYAEVWARASLEMSALCAGFGIRYVHFLQPNQYLPGGKVLTDEERAVAFDPDVADTGRVATAYPILRERGRELGEQGVAFTDLSMLFADEARSVYGDTCCHLNALGNELMATAIADAIANDAPARP